VNIINELLDQQFFEIDEMPRAGDRLSQVCIVSARC
jgi:hypothetical protein